MSGSIGETEEFNGATIMYFPFQSYRQAIALSPNMLNAHMNLGALLHIRVSGQLRICPVGVACRQVTDECIARNERNLHLSVTNDKRIAGPTIISNVTNRRERPLAEG